MYELSHAWGNHFFNRRVKVRTSLTCGLPLLIHGPNKQTLANTTELIVTNFRMPSAACIYGHPLFSSTRWRNHVCQFLWRLVKGFWRGEGSNFGLFHRVASLPLQHSRKRGYTANRPTTMRYVYLLILVSFCRTHWLLTSGVLSVSYFFTF